MKSLGGVNMVQSLGLIHASTHLISFSNDATDDIFLHISSCLQKNLKYTVILGTDKSWFDQVKIVGPDYSGRSLPKVDSL